MLKEEDMKTSECNLRLLIEKTGHSGLTEKDKFLEYFPEAYDLYIVEQDHYFPDISKVTGQYVEEINEESFKEFVYRYDRISVVLKLRKYTYLILVKSDRINNPFAHQLKEGIFKDFQLGFSILILAEKSDIAQCLKKYAVHKMDMNQKYFYGTSIILYNDMLQFGSARNKMIQENIREKLDNNQLETVNKIMNQSFLLALRTRDYQYFRQITSLYVSALFSYHMELKDNWTDIPFQAFDEDTKYMWFDAASIFQWLRRKFAELVQILPFSGSRGFSGEVEQIVAFIQESYSDYNLSVENIALRFNMSRNKLDMLMQKELKETALDYLLRIRMEEAKRLFDMGDYKISEVSEKTGFRLVTYFSNNYKKYYGVSPQAYKRNHRKE